MQRNHSFYTLPNCGMRSQTLSTLLELVQTECLEFQSCHSTESHSHKQQGPRGSDGNTNTTCDSIKEVVIKTGEQRAVASCMEFSYQSLACMGCVAWEQSLPGGGRWNGVGTRHCPQLMACRYTSTEGSIHKTAVNHQSIREEM